jgi:hypothetical protein
VNKNIINKGGWDTSHSTQASFCERSNNNCVTITGHGFLEYLGSEGSCCSWRRATAYGCMFLESCWKTYYVCIHTHTHAHTHTHTRARARADVCNFALCLWYIYTQNRELDYYYYYYYYYYFIISIMQGIHTCIPETNHVSRVYSVTALLRLLVMVHTTLSSLLNSFVLLH